MEKIINEEDLKFIRGVHYPLGETSHRQYCLANFADILLKTVNSYYEADSGMSRDDILNGIESNRSEAFVKYSSGDEKDKPNLQKTLLMYSLIKKSLEGEILKEGSIYTFLEEVLEGEHFDTLKSYKDIEEVIKHSIENSVIIEWRTNPCQVN